MESDKNYMPSTDADEGEKSSLLAHVTQKNILPTGDALSNTMSCPPATENYNTSTIKSPSDTSEITVLSN